MEKAILKTLIYADIFDYPMKAWEVHKWLIGKKATFRQVEKALAKFRAKNYYVLPGRTSLIRIRQQREKQSKKFLYKAKILAWFLKVIPTIKLVGISGGLALNNATKLDDIDLFIITAKNRIWLSRMFINLMLDFLGVRRKVKMKNNQAAGKICVNILVEEDMLEQAYQDLFVAHEVLQMKVLWQRDEVYKKYLEDNAWVFKFLPNWMGKFENELRIMKYESRSKQKNHNSLFILLDSTLGVLEILARKFQLKIMQKPQGMERIEDGALYFHPNDIREKVLKQFKTALKIINS